VPRGCQRGLAAKQRKRPGAKEGWTDRRKKGSAGARGQRAVGGGGAHTQGKSRAAPSATKTAQTRATSAPGERKGEKEAAEPARGPGGRGGLAVGKATKKGGGPEKPRQPAPAGARRAS